MNRYYSLATYLRARFGQRVQKIPLDADFSCPNRDGTISRNGCIFCNPKGSGTGLGARGLSLEKQYLFWQEKFSKKYKARLFLAYLQSYSNTYGPLKKIENMLKRLEKLPGLAGLCLGTRPDCLDKDKLSLLASYPFQEIWLELGLQSSNNHTLEIINRGHKAEDFAWAVKLAHKMGIKTCAHVIAGLPQETMKDFLQTINFLNDLPISGIKIHNLYICKHTTLAKLWRTGAYTPLSMNEYIHWLERALFSLRPDIVIHRLNGDPARGELLAPDWASYKHIILEKIKQTLTDKNLWQGKALHPNSIPPWFGGS
jgi:radical SAM protein (TIGR01212 family)